MKEIKTRETHRDIKVLDKMGEVNRHMKNAYIRTKEGPGQVESEDYATPADYAEGKITQATDTTVREGGHQIKKQGGKAVSKAKEAHRASKQAKETAQAQKAAEEAKKAADTGREAATGARETAGGTSHSASGAKSTDGARSAAQSRAKDYAVRQAEKRKAGRAATDTARTGSRAVKEPVKGGVKQSARYSVKTAGRSIKTAEQTSRTAIKTSQATAKAAARTAKASAKAAQRAAQAARAAARAAAHAAKAAAHAIAAIIKGIILATKALITAIAAGGWVAVLVILVICLIGLLVGSIFGIFFSGEDSGTGQTMQTAISEINTEYTGKIDEIKAGSTYDTLEISGSRASWPDVLAVYAVKTNTDPEAPQEVATMDDNKKALLKSIFWDMHVLSHRTETRTETEVIVTDDGNGNLVENQQTVTKTYLLISVTHKSVEEMVSQYSFSGDQQAQLAELQRPDYADLWRQVLYGISSGGNGDIVEIAATQIGNEGGGPYWSWYGFDSRVEWCACFVSWCANEAGLIETGVIPKFAACESQGVAWFKARGQWQDGGYTPAPGEIIFFDWGGDGSADHVGIVESVTDGTVNTIEGNSGDTCRRKSYSIGSSVIQGYGIPAY